MSLHVDSSGRHTLGRGKFLLCIDALGLYSAASNRNIIIQGFLFHKECVEIRIPGLARLLCYLELEVLL